LPIKTCCTGYPSRSQSYDRELKRRRCKNLKRHKQPSAFGKQKYFLLLKKPH
jgi:hypothetical protein